MMPAWLSILLLALIAAPVVLVVALVVAYVIRGAVGPVTGVDVSRAIMGTLAIYAFAVLAYLAWVVWSNTAW